MKIDTKSINAEIDRRKTRGGMKKKAADILNGLEDADSAADVKLVPDTTPTSLAADHGIFQEISRMAPDILLVAALVYLFYHTGIIDRLLLAFWPQKTAVRPGPGNGGKILMIGDENFIEKADSQPEKKEGGAVLIGASSTNRLAKLGIMMILFIIIKVLWA